MAIISACHAEDAGSTPACDSNFKTLYAAFV